jgi:hypothetical protein
MRLTDVFTLVEQADPDKIYVVGDSHAVAMGGSIPGAQVLAKNSAKLQDIAAQAQSVPDGSRVLLTGGANDIASLHTAAGASVTKIIRGLKRRNCRVVYVAFPPIDLNGEFADVYREAGYTTQYNRVQQATANAARAELGGNNVSGLSMSDISPADPNAVLATPQAYSKIAAGISQKFAKPDPAAAQSQSDVNPNSIKIDTSKIPQEHMKYLDPDGDGIVTVGDAQALGLPTETFSSYVGDEYGIFGIISNFINQNKPLNPNSPAYKNWIQNAMSNPPPARKSSTGGGATRNAQTALSFFKQAGYTDEQAAGIVGNLQAESGMNLDPGAVGDGGKAWGIAQWHEARRAIWEKASGKKWQPNGSSPNFKEQLDFIVYELKRTENRANTRLRATKTVEDAASVFDQYYERSSGQARQKRIELAQALLGSTGSTQSADASGVATNGNPLFGLDGASKMTQSDAADEMAKTIARYKRMVAMLNFPVKVNDAIAKAGTSRERDTKGSQHFHGTALDLSIAGLSQEQVKKLLVAAKQVGFTGFGFGNSILHVDTGPSRTWDYGNADFAGLSLPSVKRFATA